MKLIKACREGNLPLIKKLLQDPDIYIHSGNEMAWRDSCRYGHIEVVKLLLSIGHSPSNRSQYINIHAYNECAWVFACKNGRIEVATLLLSLEGDRYIDVHADNEWAWCKACEHNQLEIVELLLSLKYDRFIDVHFNHDEAWMWGRMLDSPRIIETILEYRSYLNFSYDYLVKDFLSFNSTIAVRLTIAKRIPKKYLNEKQLKVFNRCGECALMWYDKWLKKVYQPNGSVMLKEMNELQLDGLANQVFGGCL
jgi:hypothetical protein